MHIALGPGQDPTIQHQEPCAIVVQASGGGGRIHATILRSDGHVESVSHHGSSGNANDVLISKAGCVADGKSRRLVFLKVTPHNAGSPHVDVCTTVTPGTRHQSYWAGQIPAGKSLVFTVERGFEFL